MIGIVQVTSGNLNSELLGKVSGGGRKRWLVQVRRLPVADNSKGIESRPLNSRSTTGSGRRPSESCDLLKANRFKILVNDVSRTDNIGSNGSCRSVFRDKGLASINESLAILLKRRILGILGKNNLTSVCDCVLNLSTLGLEVLNLLCESLGKRDLLS